MMDTRVVSKDMKERLGVVKSIDEENRTITGYASTASIDRHGEIVDPKAFKKDLKRFLRAPPVCSQSSLCE